MAPSPPIRRPLSAKPHPRRVTVRLALAPLLFIAWNAAAEAPLSGESVTAFNTVCAKCHEGQCSGRLSFGDEAERSAEHIQRHYPRAAVDSRVSTELFTLLAHMKAKCAFHPLKAPPNGERSWRDDTLDKLSTPDERYYFIPLGRLPAGRHRIDLELERDTRLTIHLVRADFEMLVDECASTTGRRISVPFEVEEAAEHYLRLYPRDAVRVTRLVVQSE